MGKGSTSRPFSVSKDAFAERWARTFGGGDPYGEYSAPKHASEDEKIPLGNIDAAADGQFQQKPSDPADAASGSRRAGGWAVAEWLAFLERNPDATLPSGVGKAIVAHYEARVEELAEDAAKYRDLCR